MKALILVDIQNDFLPGGALAVPHGDEVVPVANRLMPQYDLVVATQDWHPADHQSFASQHHGRSIGEVIQVDGLQQILWPDHCVQNTPGAELAAQLNVDGIQFVVQKGTDRLTDSYSGFFDNQRRKATGLADLLGQHQVTEVDVMGLATDYCVKFTALDAVDLGFKTRVIVDGVRGVDLTPGDCQNAIAVMRARGITLISASEGTLNG
jgi:nicotinamidase/pyrazinamidase